MTADNKALSRFWSKVDIGREDECWVWRARITRGGYGQFHFQKKMRSAHRVAWLLTFGSLPDDACVLHKCDNRPCVSPSHLFLGSKGDNARDRDKKLRGAVGERNGRAKLTTDDILEIRRLCEAGRLHQHQIGVRFGVAQSTITDVHTRKKWGHVP